MHFTDHPAAGHIQRSKQRGGAVAAVIVRASLGLARLHRQHGLGAIQGLDLTLLIGAQH